MLDPIFPFTIYIQSLYANFISYLNLLNVRLGLGSKTSSLSHIVDGWWGPVRSLPWNNVRCIQLINLFQRKTLCLSEAEVDKEKGEDQTSGKNETVVEVNGRSDERSEERNQKSPHPVGRSGHCHTLGTDSQWVSLRHNGVDTSGPSGCKEKDKQTSDENHGVTGWLSGVFSSVGVTIDV